MPKVPAEDQRYNVIVSLGGTLYAQWQAFQNTGKEDLRSVQKVYDWFICNKRTLEKYESKYGGLIKNDSDKKSSFIGEHPKTNYKN